VYSVGMTLLLMCLPFLATWRVGGGECVSLISPALFFRGGECVLEWMYDRPLRDGNVPPGLGVEAFHLP
jgi:hypothetical protein